MFVRFNTTRTISNIFVVLVCSTYSIKHVMCISSFSPHNDDIGEAVSQMLFTNGETDPNKVRETFSSLHSEKAA